MPSHENFRERFVELDACRGIAAATVVAAHLTLHFDMIFGFSGASFAADLPNGAVFLVSRLPVYFFFMISGYVIGLTLLRVSSLREFAVCRFARLFPAYWAAIALTVSALLMFPSIGKPPSIQEVVGNLTMLQGIIGIRNIDPVYWSLTYELVFYGLIASCFAFMRATPRALAYFAASWLAASAIAYAAAPDLPATNALFAHLFQYAPFFTGGIGFFLWRAGARNWLTKVVICVSGVIAVTRVEFFGTAALVLFGLFFLVASGRISILKSPPLLYLGRISYPLYLFHLAPGFLIVSALDGAGAPPAVSVGAALAAAVIFAHVLHVVVEAPAREWLRRFSRPLISRANDGVSPREAAGIQACRSDRLAAVRYDGKRCARPTGP